MMNSYDKWNALLTISNKEHAMKKWQKTWLTLLASSLAVGCIAQGEATVIKIEGASITQAQPVKVIIVDSNGRTFEQIANYDPSAGGIDIDTSWAGPNASIFIPSLNIGYVWYNGYWVNQEGYYWNGTQRVAVPYIPQWREHWNHYWQARRGGEGWQGGREGRWQGREGDWSRGESWQGRGSQAGPSGAYHGEQGGAMRSAGGPQGSAMRSAGSYQDGQSDGMMSPGGQGGAMRSAGGPQGGQSDGMVSPGGQGGAMRSAGGPQGEAASSGNTNSGSGMGGSSRPAK
jgi:hypothetical protein